MAAAGSCEQPWCGVSVTQSSVSPPDPIPPFPTPQLPYSLSSHLLPIPYIFTSIFIVFFCKFVSLFPPKYIGSIQNVKCSLCSLQKDPKIDSSVGNGCLCLAYHVLKMSVSAYSLPQSSANGNLAVIKLSRIVCVTSFFL